MPPSSGFASGSHWSSWQNRLTTPIRVLVSSHSGLENTLFPLSPAIDPTLHPPQMHSFRNMRIRWHHAFLCAEWHILCHMAERCRQPPEPRVAFPQSLLEPRVVFSLPASDFTSGGHSFPPCFGATAITRLPAKEWMPLTSGNGDWLRPQGVGHFQSKAPGACVNKSCIPINPGPWQLSDSRIEALQTWPALRFLTPPPQLQEPRAHGFA